MRLLRIEASQFLAYDTLDLDLSGVEQLAITGPVGAGKSSLLDAVTWSLWGRARGSADQLVRHGQQEARVTTSWDVAGQQVSITRIRNRHGRGESSLLLTVDGLDQTRHTIGETQAAIDSLVGAIAPVVFAGPLMVQGQSGEFMAMSPAERKELLFRMLELDRYVPLADAARKLEHQSAALASVCASSIEEFRAVEARLLGLKQAVADAERAMADAEAEEEAARTELAEEHARSAELVAQGQRREELRAASAQADASAQALEASYKKSLADDQRRLGQLATQVELVSVVPCHGEGEYATCPLLHHAVEAPAEAERIVDKMQVDAEAHSAAKVPLEEAARGARKALLKLENIDGEISAAATRIRELDAAVADARLRSRAAVAAHATCQAEYDQAREQVAQIPGLVDRARDAQDRAGKARLLAAAFGRDGIPTMVMESALPSLEAQANDLLDRMPAGFRLELATQQEQKTTATMRETLEVVLSAGGTEQAYGLASGGEKMQVDLALRTALATLTRFETLWVDEGWGSQDKDGRDAIVAGMLAADAFPLVVAVSHVDDVADRFPSRLEVTKAGGIAQVALA